VERWWPGDQPWDRTTFSRASAERYDHTSSLVGMEPTAGDEPAPAPYEGAVLPATLRRRGMVQARGLEPPCAVCRTAVLPLNEPAVGRGGGNRTRMAELMRLPRSPSLPPHIRSGPAWMHRRRRRGMRPPHPGRTWTGIAHRPIDIGQLSKTPLDSSWWAARDSNPNAPRRRTGLRPVCGPSARTARLATAPGFEPGPTSFGDSDASVTPRCRSRLQRPPFQRQNLPAT
jgi:hypothetical protein